MKILKQLLVMFGAALLLVSGSVLGDCQGPSDGTGRPDWAGTQCSSEVMEVLGVEDEGDRDRNRDCPDAGPNQNPDPGYGGGK
jgi:hypothetical protein